MRRLALLLALSACAEVPEFQGTETDARDASYPDLVAIAPILGQAATLAQAPGPQTSDARLAALRTRAGGLRGAVIAPEDAARLRAGVRTGALQ